VAGTDAVPPGYQANQMILPNPPGTQSGVYAVDSVNTIYYGHSNAAKTMFEVKSGRSSGSQIWRYDPVAGTHTLFYSSAASGPGEYGINSVSGIVIDETTMPWTYYIADQEPEKGEPWTTGGVWIAQDLNGDGTIMDAADRVELYTTDLSVLVYISDIIRNHATGDIYVTNAVDIEDNPMVYCLRDDDLSGTIETSEIYPYALLPESGNFAGGLCFGLSDDIIYTHDTSGTIYRLEDLNSNGDALDPGETTIFAELPISGGYHIGFDTDNDLFVSASDWSTMTHAIYQITMDTEPVVTLFHDLTGQVGFIGNFVFAGSTPFEPFQAGDAVMYLSYSTAEWSDPDNFVIISPASESVDVPATGLFGIGLLLLALGAWLQGVERKS
jgi:hypothetical protein